MWGREEEIGGREIYREWGIGERVAQREKVWETEIDVKTRRVKGERELERGWDIKREREREI